MKRFYKASSLISEPLSAKTYPSSMHILAAIKMNNKPKT